MKRTAIIITLLLASCFSLTAQNNFIVCGIPDLNRDTYNDIPDTTIQPLYGKSGQWYQWYDFDMDGNGVVDLRINTYNWENAGGGGSENQLLYRTDNIKFAFGEQLVDTIGNYNPPWIQYYNFPKANNYNDTIDSRYNFLLSNLCISIIGGPGVYYIDHPGWLDIGEKYIGISMEKNDVTLYGYILVEVTGYSHIIIKEFAMNKNPYIGITPIAAQAFELYPNPATNEVFLKLNGENAGKTARFTLYDLSGKKLLQLGDIPQNGRIALPALAKGLYIAEIIIDGQRFSKKLMIE